MTQYETTAPTVPALLAKWAQEQPAAVFALLPDGAQWTYAEAHTVAVRTAAALSQLGVAAGDRVLSWLPNGGDALRVWFGANQLNATYVPVNIAFRGRLLEHAIATAGARVAVVHRQLLDRLSGIDLSVLERIVVVGGDVPAQMLPVDLLDAAALEPTQADLSAWAVSPAQPWDPYAIIYTSGTTGPSKGVLCPHAHGHATALSAFSAIGMTRADRYMVNLPLFHAGGTAGVFGALTFGSSIAVVEAFDTAAFWDVVRDTGTTCCTLLGVMATFLAKQPVSGRDRDHPLRAAYVVPLVADAAAFSSRFGTDVYTMFNMTEVSCPIISSKNPDAAGSCGIVRTGIEARLVDTHDQPVPDGGIGELILRSEQPWTLNSGYFGNAEATAQAWRNGWFHTGDAFRKDDAGNFYFVDRTKDAIRRRGENISSFEVELELLAHPAVRECAAVAVPSDHSEDDVLAVIALLPGESLDPAELISFLVARMPHFMVPRYVRVLTELPKTPTNKVEKHLLRAQGLTADTWDRESAGISIRRERIGST